jgi:hypothetical protein
MAVHDHDRQRNQLAVWLIVATIMFAVYVLSPGPFFWLVAKGYVDRGIVWIFLPLETLYNHCPPVRAFYDWYFTLLGVQP